MGGAVALWLVRRIPDRAVRVRASARALRCETRHFTLTVPFFTQVYKWVPTNFLLGVTLQWTSIPCRGSRNTPCYWNRDKLRPDGPLGSNADFTLPLPHKTNTGMHRFCMAHFKQHVERWFRKMNVKWCQKMAAMHVTLKAGVNSVWLGHLVYSFVEYTD